MKQNLNQHPLPDSTVFASRGTKTKWPTFRGVRLTAKKIHALYEYARRQGHSIIFLEGQYDSSLNKMSHHDPHERAVFFEFLLRHPEKKGGIYLLVWIGNYHAGSIFHCGWQYPHANCWEQNGEQTLLERAAFVVYRRIASIMYDGIDMDEEVKAFLEKGEFKP